MPPSHLISLRIPALIGHQPQHPRSHWPGDGATGRPGVAACGGPGQSAQHLIRSRIWAENIYWPAPVSAQLCSDIWRIYVGILRPIAPPPGSCGGKIKCHKIWAWPVSWSDRSTSCLRHDLNWRVSTFGGCCRGPAVTRLRHKHATKLAANV